MLLPALGLAQVLDMHKDLLIAMIVMFTTQRIWTKYICTTTIHNKKTHTRRRRYYIHHRKHKYARIGIRTGPRIQSINAYATSTTTDHATNQTTNLSPPFDSDSFLIAIDNCASSCFTNNRNDYITHRSTNTIVRGVGNQKLTTIGTVKWQLQDDRGRKHTFIIPNVYHAPQLPWRLLSPQHLAQTRNDNEGTGCLTLGDRLELFWDHRKYRKTLPLSENNIGLTYSAPNPHKFYAFAATIPPLESPHIIPFDPDELDSPEMLASKGEPISKEEAEPIENDEAAENDKAAAEPIDFADSTQALPKSLPENLTAKQWELMKLHYRLGHISMHRLRAMAKQGLINKSLADIPPPMCAACQFGKATKKPWRTKTTPHSTSKLKPITAPGHCISVDQLESPNPGFIGQIKGRLTTQRYRVATIFVDHFSRFGYVHLQTSTSSEETLKGKKEFEGYCRSVGVQIKHYHADNGRFADNAWLADVATKQQTISFCGV